MTARKRTFHRLRGTGPAAALLAAGLAVLAPVPPMGGTARAQGEFLIYGNYCGPGNRGPGYPPIDALDSACARHDACSPRLGGGQLPTCACNQRLQVEAGIVARDPYAPRSTRDTAQFISDFAGVLPCR